jgi:hypothetical protein
MSDKDDEGKTHLSNHFWQTQYELLSNWQIGEADRFWTRFQISLALNGGLLVAYSAIFGMKSEDAMTSFARLLGPLAISAVGIVLSVIWHLLTNAGVKWQDYWVMKGIEIEKAHPDEIKVRIFADIPGYENIGRVRKYRAAIPILFIVTWILLFFLTLIPFIFPNTVIDHTLIETSNSTGLATNS